MNAASTAAITMSGVVLLAGLYHLLFYLRAKLPREHLAFAFTCLAVFIYDLLCAGLYAATTPESGLVWQRWQSVVLALLGIFILWFISDLTKRKARHWDAVFSAYWVIQAAIQMFTEWSWADQTAVKRLIYFGSQEIAIFEKTPGLLQNVQSIVGLAAFIYVLTTLFRFYLAGNRSRSLPIIIALCGFFVGVINDILVSNNTYSSIYLIEYTYTLLVIAMAITLVSGQLKVSEALRESSERYRELVDNLDEGLILVDKHENVLFANSLTDHIFGVPPGGIIGKNLSDFAEPDQFAMILSQTANRKSGTAGTYELEIKRPDGEKRTVEVTVSPRYDGKGDYIGAFGPLRDITEQVQAQSELRRVQMRLGILLENLSDVVFYETGGGREYISDNIFSLIGYPAAQLTQDREFFPSLMHPDDHPQATDSVKDWSGAGRKGVVTMQFRVKRSDGTYIWLEDRMVQITRENEQTYMAGVLIDISQRMKAETELHESLKLIQEERSVFMSGPTVFFNWRNLPGWPVKYVSPNVEKVLGYSGQEFIDGDIQYSDLIFEADMERVAHEVQTNSTNGVERFEHMPYRLVSKSGKVIWVADYTNIVRDEAGEITNYVGYIVDITQRFEAEQEAMNSRLFLRRVIDNVPAEIVVRDKDSRILLANSEFAAAYNKTPDELVGVHDADMWASAGRSSQQISAWLEEDSRILETGDTMEYVQHIDRPDGSEVFIHNVKQRVKLADGSLCLLGTYADVTEQVQSEQAVRQSEEQYRSTIDSLTDAIHVVDLELRVILHNSELERFHTRLDLSEQIDGLQLFELYPFLPEVTKEEYRHVIETAQILTTEESYGLAGQEISVEVRKVPIITDGKVTRIITLIRDITSKKKSERERRKLESRVQQAQKLESLGLLAGGIAHDFNNLLVGILGNASLALMEMLPESPARDSVEHIEIAGRRAAELTNQMLAYSGKGKFVISSLNLSVLVQEMAHLLQTVISKKAMFRFDFADDLPRIKGDATQIRQVVMNLITNASDALGDNPGTISIRTNVVNADRYYLSQFLMGEELEPGYHVCIEVSDTGIGMTQETKEKIFDPFFTMKLSGRGLGLAAVMGIVKGHGGAIKVYSELGSGTTFKILFPLGKIQEVVEMDREPEKSESQVAGIQGTVLVVDDEEMVRVVANRTLSKLGLTILLAENGSQGLMLFEKHCHEIDCVILDMMMPDMNGEEAFIEMRKIKEDVVVLLSSGYSEQDAISRIKDAGGVRFIQKPYDVQTLIDQVTEVLQDMNG